VPGQDDLLPSLAALGRALFGAAACSVALLDADEAYLTYVAASGAGAEHIVGTRLPVNRGIAGWVVSSGQPIGVDDVRRDPRFESAVAESTGYVPRSILAVPIEADGDPVGVMQVLDAAVLVDRDDMATLGLLSAHASACLSLLRDAQPETHAQKPQDLDALITELRSLRFDEKQAAGQLLSAFLAYTRR
jgi:signal transduction protein with GAF and PtsI domain